MKPQTPKFVLPIGRTLALLMIAPLIPVLLPAQQSAADDNVDEETTIELSPFEVDASQDQGYYSAQTMAGGRLKTNLKDVATSVQVVTAQFMEDIGASSLDEVLAYTTATEAVGSMSDYLQVEDTASNGDLDQSRARQDPDSALRVRGLASPTRTTNYFESAIPFNRYASGRIDINRGANSFLFGLGSPGGIVNTTLDQANLNRDSVRITHRISTENFEDNYSNEVSLSLNKVLIEDKLAVRIAALETKNEFMQKPAFKDESRQFIALKFKPFAERNINISANYETGDTTGVPVDRLGPLETLSLFVDDPYGTVWPSSIDGAIPNRAGRRINDPFNAMRDGVSSGHAGLDVNGARLSNTIYNQFLKRNGWASVFDGSTGRTDGLPDLGIYTGWRGGVGDRFGRGNSYYNPFNARRAGGANESVLSNNLNYSDLQTNVLPQYVGFNNQGLLDYDVFDFSRHLISGSIDNLSTEFDRTMLFIDASTADGNFGIELAYSGEESSRTSFVAVGAPEIDIDMNYTNPAGPEGAGVHPDTGLPLGERNPNFGRLYIYAPSSTRTVNADEREAMRATAFARYDFAEKFQGGILSKLGNHSLSVLFDEAEVSTERFADRPYVFGNSPEFHLGEQATIFQRAWSGIFYISDPIMQAFENPNFSLSDFHTTGLPANAVLDFPEDYEIPLSYLSFGDPLVDESRTSVTGDERPATGSYTPRFQPSSGTLTKTETSSQAVNLQSFFLGGHLVSNLGYREDQVTLTRNNQAPRYAIPDADGKLPDNRISGGADIVNLPILTPDLFRLENGTIDKQPKSDTFGYGFVLKAPDSWLPEGLGLSAHYGSSSNFTPNPGAFNFYGESVPGASGDTKDYGITINLGGDKLVARINRYEASVKNGQFGGVGTAAAVFSNVQTRFYNFMYRDISSWDYDFDGVFDDPTVDPDGDGRVGNATNTLTLAQAHGIWNALDGFWTDFAKEVGEFEIVPGTLGARGRVLSNANNLGEVLSDTMDQDAEGTELSLTWNPTRQLRMSVSASKTDVQRANVAPNFSRMLEDWTRAFSEVEFGSTFTGNGNGILTRALGPVPWGGGTFAGTPLRDGRQGQALFKALAFEGTTSPEVARHSFRALGNYMFTEGLLNGFKMGGAFRWTDARAIGYGSSVLNYLPDEVNVEVPVVDVTKPFFSKADGKTDVWLGYSRKVFNDKARWSIQMNIRNLFADSKPIVIQRQPDGSPGRTSIPSHRQFILTNTLSF